MNAIKHATKAASKSTFRQRVGACIVKSGRILSVGTNCVGASSRYSTFPHAESIHAEQAAIAYLLGVRQRHHLRGATIYVSRINPLGKCRLAKPCEFCMHAIISVGIKRVVFTTNEETTEVINL